MISYFLVGLNLKCILLLYDQIYIGSVVTTEAFRGQLR